MALNAARVIRREDPQAMAKRLEREELAKDEEIGSGIKDSTSVFTDGYQPPRLKGFDCFHDHPDDVTETAVI